MHIKLHEIASAFSIKPPARGLKTVGAFDLAAAKAEPKGPADFYRQHSFEVYLWSDLWRVATGPQQISWNEVPFDEASTAVVPNEPGIYAFKIAIRNTIMPDHGIIVYFGQSGAGSDGTLHNRFKQYLRDKKRGPKRPKFEWLFKTWPNDLKFCFASLECTEAQLRQLENDLSDAVIPVCSKMDFSAHVRRIVDALRT